MKRIMYVLGMVLALVGCSSKEEKGSSSVTGDSIGDSKINYLYSSYDFRQDNPGCEISGFSDNESFGRWSNGDTATIDLMAAPMAEITVKMDVDRVITPEDIPFEFEVEVNGEHVSHISTNGHNSVFVNIGKENMGADGSVRMMFIFKNATTPDKYNPENHDGRKLGFGISGLTVYGYSLK